MQKRESLWKALNASSLLLGVGAVLAGNASAQVHGNAEFFPATICLLFVIFLQLAANAYHRYYALQVLLGVTSDSIREGNTDRPLYERLMFYKAFSFGLGIMALIAGSTLVSMGGFWFGVVGFFVLVASWAMTGGKNPLLLSVWGFVFTFIMFGPVTVICTSLLESAHEATDPLGWFDISPSLYMSAIVGFMAANAYLTFVYATYSRSKTMMRYTFTAVYGRKATRILFLVFSLLAFGMGIWGCFSLSLDSPWLGLVPSVVCLAINLYIWRQMSTRPRYKLTELAELACLNVTMMGLLTSIVSIFVGIPDDSHMRIF